MMEYKGYTGIVEFDDDANLFHGEVIDIRDVVTFQGATADELRQAFRDSVDDYLAFCRERGEDPDKPFSGKLMLRIPPALHKKLFVQARRTGKSLNALIAEYLAEGVNDREVS
ncbi:MAG: type II toxin-antitoxin system HicB family antitoxin [Candidatus Melainabacteria bacterium]